jgi:hypothetical protein
MAHKPIIVKVKDCIKYIEGCGWKLDYYNRPWYVFKSLQWPTSKNPRRVTFTLTELRHAYNNGW